MMTRIKKLSFLKRTGRLTNITKKKIKRYKYHLRKGFSLDPETQEQLGKFMISLAKQDISARISRYNNDYFEMPFELYLHGTRGTAVPNILKLGRIVPGGTLPVKYMKSGELSFGITSKGVSKKYVSFVPTSKIEIAKKYAEKYGKLPISKKDKEKERKDIIETLGKLGNFPLAKEALKKRLLIIKNTEISEKERKLDFPVIIATAKKPDLHTSFPGGFSEALYYKIPVSELYFFVPKEKKKELTKYTNRVYPMELLNFLDPRSHNKSTITYFGKKDLIFLGTLHRSIGHLRRMFKI